MHETSLIKGLVQQINSIVKKEGASKVVRLTVQLGALSQISLDHFRDHFAMGSKGTIIENAQLEVVADTDALDEAAQTVMLTSIEVE
jgi:hydrogenase nickel incorporation protein HypA/HybF